MDGVFIWIMLVFLSASEITYFQNPAAPFAVKASVL
jgi:hypothetical protein